MLIWTGRHEKPGHLQPVTPPRGGPWGWSPESLLRCSPRAGVTTAGAFGALSLWSPVLREHTQHECSPSCEATTCPPTPRREKLLDSQPLPWPPMHDFRHWQWWPFTEGHRSGRGSSEEEESLPRSRFKGSDVKALPLMALNCDSD